MTSREIRETFLEFFKNKNHHIVSSAPMVIKGDPTLMFTNAGMNQFKDIILGNSPIKYSRIADSQKCLRVSGKHNDLEEVGYDTYHHTMFEMLGNWSFGDYFKKEAIQWAWEFLTEVLKLEKDRLYVTVFEGDISDNLNKDQEAFEIWSKLIDSSRIIDGSKKDNFWEMGDIGPCGPCSEIHIDIRSNEERTKISGINLVNKDHPQVVEIWNLVFMQFDRKADKSLVALPAKVIDTGMGFERLCMAVQGKISNYDTDNFQIIIKSISSITGYQYGVDSKVDIAMRVIADHIRTISFSITDGQLPSNVKAGYVIRRILRRAVRYGYTFLNQHTSFMYKLVPALIEVMGSAYPELNDQKSLIEKVIKEEEESFFRTLETGIKLLDVQITELKAQNKEVLDGKIAFTLYDTYGFPLDLTQLILRENRLIVDQEVFEQEMQKQKDRARNAANIEAEDWIVLKNTDTVEFVGYDFTECETSIAKYRKIKQKGKELYQIVLTKTPFYAEKGGQVGDTGFIINTIDGESIKIFDTKSENNLVVHLSERLPSNVNSQFKAIIDSETRKATEANHTATHLLHEALREVLGKHVEQKGSFVSSNLLRFDFSHFQKVTDEEIRIVERIVNKKIRDNFRLEDFRNIPIEKAKSMGAMALFGEKYGEDVRVVKYGDSIELCGGTHVKYTGNIGSFKIVSESSIAAGIRRIEAITAEKAENFNYELLDTFLQIKTLFNNSPNLLSTIKKQLEENDDIKHQVEEFKKEKSLLIKNRIIEEKEYINGITIFSLRGIVYPDLVKDISFQLMGQFSQHSVFIATTESEDKPNITLAITKDLIESDSKLNASKIIREASQLIDGGGGGQAHFASAGGKKVTGLDEAYNYILEKIIK